MTTLEVLKIALLSMWGGAGAMFMIMAGIGRGGK